MKFKDIFNQQYVSDLACAIRQVYPALDGEALLSGIFDDEWDARELKERMRHVTLVLGRLLPADYRAALPILRQAAPSLKHYGFENMVFPDYVSVFGLDDWEASLPALEAFTQLISAEYAVRPFIVRDQGRMMAQMLGWAYHESADVRRLASEGCRPRLPWGIRLPMLEADPAPILPILDALKHDPSESVRRSVANNLNDISKAQPGIVLELLRRWQEEDGEAVKWIVSHALRTLLKAGHPGALDLLGFASQPLIAVSNISVEPEAIRLGESVTLRFEIESLADEPVDLLIDYVVYHRRARGELSPKVFKLSKRKLKPGQVLTISREHSFRPITTRRYYPGKHAVEPQINGQTFGRVHFTLAE